MTGAMLISLVIIIVPSMQLNDAFSLINEDDLFTSLDQFRLKYVQGLQLFGTISGTYFLLIGMAILVMFWELFRLIDTEHRLSESLQHQKGGLKTMVTLVFISYFLGAGILYCYGQMQESMSLFQKWLIYPILALLVELPNMLVIYMIHWWTYRPILPPTE